MMHIRFPLDLINMVLSEVLSCVVEGLSVVVRSKSRSDILESVFVVVRNVSKNMASPVEGFACNQEGGYEVY